MVENLNPQSAEKEDEIESVEEGIVDIVDIVEDDPLSEELLTDDPDDLLEGLEGASEGEYNEEADQGGELEISSILVGDESLIAA